MGDSTCIKERRCFLTLKHEMTIERCKEYCRENGWAIAGVEWSKECFCGNDIPKERIADSNCNRVCSGDSQQICGGGWAMNIYHVSGEVI